MGILARKKEALRALVPLPLREFWAASEHYQKQETDDLKQTYELYSRRKTTIKSTKHGTRKEGKKGRKQERKNESKKKEKQKEKRTIQSTKNRIAVEKEQSKKGRGRTCANTALFERIISAACAPASLSNVTVCMMSMILITPAGKARPPVALSVKSTT